MDERPSSAPPRSLAPLPAPPTFDSNASARSVTRTPASSRSPWALDTRHPSASAAPAPLALACRQTFDPVRRDRALHVVRHVPLDVFHARALIPHLHLRPRARPRALVVSGRHRAEPPPRLIVAPLHRRVRLSRPRRDARRDARPRASSTRRDAPPRRRASTSSPSTPTRVSGPVARAGAKVHSTRGLKEESPSSRRRGTNRNRTAARCIPRHTRARDPIDRARAREASDDAERARPSRRRGTVRGAERCAKTRRHRCRSQDAWMGAATQIARAFAARIRQGRRVGAISLPPRSRSWRRIARISAVRWRVAPGIDNHPAGTCVLCRVWATDASQRDGVLFSPSKKRRGPNAPKPISLKIAYREIASVGVKSDWSESGADAVDA